jgi:D-xylonolactonase
MTSNLTEHAIEFIADAGCVCGENPLWDERRQVLFWTDISTGRLFRFSAQTQDWQQIYSGEPIGGFTLQETGELLLFRGREVCLWRENESTLIVAENSDETTGRFNDAIADPHGRVFAGTMDKDGDFRGGRSGALYRVDLNGKMTKLLDGTGCANGMGFSPDEKTFYWTDSTARVIYAFDYDMSSGEISRRRSLVTLEGEAMPDGLAIDEQGCLWSAHCFGGMIARYSPKGELLETVAVPERDVTSLCFGGEDRNEIFVTTAGGDSLEYSRGTLYRFQVQVRGRREFRSRVG